MERSPRLILPFALLFAIMFMAPGLLSEQFAFYELIKVGDVLDILTPLVLIPMYWWLWQESGQQAPRPYELLLFLILIAMWVEGQGMHLSANSIGHVLTEPPDADASLLTYFYDEKLSHYLWHVGVMGLSALLLLREWRQQAPYDRRVTWAVGLAGVIHGLTYFVIIVEAGTGPIGVPFAALVALAILIWGRPYLRQRPLLAFFFISYLLAALLFIGWSIYWGGLLEFSDPRVGWIS